MNKKDRDGSPQSTGRKTYTAPRIVYREPLEAVAAVCTGPPDPAKSDVVCTGQLMS